MNLLSLDISTNTTGVAIFINNKYYKSQYIKFNKKKSDYNNYIDAKNKIHQLIKKHNITDVVIEKPLEYLPGSSTSKTIIKLQKINILLQYSIIEAFNIIPELIDVKTVRAFIKKDCNLLKAPKKEELPDLIYQYYNIEIREYSKNNKIKNYCLDISDAICLGFYYKEKK